jgi:hypothetical protein
MAGAPASLFLGVGKGVVGTIGGGKAKPTGKIDIAVMQSLSRQGEVNPLVEDYGQVIVDECHHVGAVSFDAILKRTKAKYVLGLTATPIRRDGQQPIIFMQCGPIRHTAAKPAGAPHDLEVVPHSTPCPDRSATGCWHPGCVPASGQRPGPHRGHRQPRSRCLRQGRKVLVLTERTEHLDAIKAPGRTGAGPFVLHGRMSKKQRADADRRAGCLAARRAARPAGHRQAGWRRLRPPAARHLVLAMPVSWKGTLQQYAGRLHREHASKTDVRIIDFVDTGHPALLRMWDKRQRGYRAMGYTANQW